MSSTFSPRFGFERPATQSLGGLWGNTINNAITNLVDEAIDSIVIVAMADANQIITIPNGTASANRAGTIRCTGALTANRTITVPAGDRVVRVTNATTGGFSILAQNPSSGTVSVPPGATATIAMVGATATEMLPKLGNISTATVVATTSATARSLAARHGEKANVRDFGAVGDNIADDTAAFVAAAATGKPIFAPPGQYLLTAGITLNTDGQSFEGCYDTTVLRPVGNFDLFTVPGPRDGIAIEKFRVSGPGITGGFILNINGGDRVDFRHVTLYDLWNGVRVFQANAVTLEDIFVQQPRGPDFILGTGTGSANRSDLIRIIDVNVGGPSTGPHAYAWNGLRIAGFVNTVQIDRFTVVNYRRGIFVESSSTDALFIVANDFEADFGLFEVLRLEAGGSYWFNQSYMQGSAHGGGAAPLVFAGSAVNNLRIMDSYLTTANGAPVLDIGCDDTTVSGCELLLPGWPTAGMDTDVAVVRGTSRRVRMMNNQWGGREGVGLVARYGVRVESGARSVQVSGDFSGCRLGALLDESGAGTGSGVQVVGATSSDKPLPSIIAGAQVGCSTGWGADASPVLSSGALTGMTLLAGGQDYLTPPAVLIFDPLGTGTGASAVAVINGEGAVTGFTSIVGGSGYSAGTRVELRAPVTAPTIMARVPGVANTSMNVRSSQQGSVRIGSGRGDSLEVFANAASTVNRVQVIGTQAGISPVVRVEGADANLDLSLRGKGTGVIDFGGSVVGTAGAPAGFLNAKINGVAIKIPYNLV